MKLEKRVDRNKGIDQYILYINHSEADTAFQIMTPLEKGMIADLQHSDQISTILKVLLIWVQRIEKAQGIQEKPREGREDDEGQ